LLLKFAARVCRTGTLRSSRILFPRSTDITDYMRLAESLLDKFGDGLCGYANLEARLRRGARNGDSNGLISVRSAWNVTPAACSSVREFSPQTQAQGSLGSFLPARTIKRRDLLLDDLQNIGISKSDLALTIRKDHFQFFASRNELQCLLLSQTRLFSRKPRLLRSQQVAGFTRKFI